MSKSCAIIGAGASGLPTAKWSLTYGHKTTVFEATDSIGGLWNFKPDETEFATVMKSTVINTSKEMTAYSDFPPRATEANFMHNRRLKQYLIDYAEKFGILDCVKFNHRVLNVERAEDYQETGKWTIHYIDNKGTKHTEIFDMVVVCTGHHAKPNFAHFPGQEKFKGRVIHSHSYKDHVGYEDKNVVVVGIGNSGIDVACELSRIAKNVYLSTRRGAWIVRKTADNGIPADLSKSRFFAWYSSKIPRYIRWQRERACNRVMDHDVYGLRPKHRINQQHSSASDELHGRINSGTIVVKCNISQFTENSIVFEDGTELEDVDEVIMATGYWFDFPYLDGGKLVPVKENRCKLYKKMFPLTAADKNTIALIGLIQPHGSIVAFSEMQARLFFAVQAGQCQLASIEEMRQETDEADEKLRSRYVESPRHTIQADYTPYMSELSRMIGACPRPLDYILSDFPLFLKLAFGPDLPYAYRLKGPFPSPNARKHIMECEERRIKATRKRDTGFGIKACSCNTLPQWLIIGLLFMILLKLVF